MTGEIPGNVALQYGHDSADLAGPPIAGDVVAHRPASTQKLSHPPQPLREEKQKPADAGLFFLFQAQASRDDATLGLPTAFPSLGVAPRGVYR